MKRSQRKKNVLMEKWDAIGCFIKHAGKLAKIIFMKRDTTNMEYQDLAPIDDVSECEEHIKALEWAFSNSRIKNIALTGPYGSGKSSIINTFLKRNPLLEDKSVRISLATFADIGSKDDLEGHQEIEKGILKQLFYKVEQHKIPQSRYRKIHRISRFRVFIGMVFCLTIAAILTFIFCPDILETTYNLIIAAGSKIAVPTWFALAIFGLIILVALMVATKIFQLFACRISIKEIKLPTNTTVKGNEIDKESIFDKNIDEIVYFFEVTGLSIVFIEDLDRFKDAKIFIQLRELNTLLNNYDAIKQPIVFVYAIRDDIFTDAERTKFFEFIIPVIPVINSTNSGEILLKMLQSEDTESYKHDISPNYVLDISPYISDMRILQNIYNEFVLYKATLKIGQQLTLSDESMMSLIVFKNLYPKHFAALQDEAGIVKQAFKDKDRFVAKKQAELKQRINTLSDLLNKIAKDTLNDTRELKTAMLAAITNWNGVAYRVSCGSRCAYYADAILQDDFDIMELLQNGSWTVQYSTPRGSNSTLQYQSINEICSRYADRLNYLKEAGKERQVSMRAEIEALTVQTRNIATWPLKRLVTEFGAEKIFATPEVQDNALLVFMLRKGYIDEKYVDYINFFKGSSITTEDMNFILSVKNQNPKPYTYNISKTPQVLLRLQNHEFAEKAILNFDLLEYMLSNHENDDKLSVFMQQLSNESTDSWKFIDEFIDRTNYEKRFVKLLADNWSGWWADIYHNHVLTFERKIRYLTSLCYYLDLETLSALNSNGLIVKFFVEHENILQHLPSDLTTKITQIISEFNICFQRLQIAGVSPQLLDFIFDNRHYELNVDMIQRIVECKEEGLCIYLDTQNYTTIINLGYGALLDYVYEKLEIYIDSIILRESNVEESVSSITDLLERRIEDITQCKKVIEHENFFVDAIESVCYQFIETAPTSVQEIWNSLISNGKVSVTWKNVYKYWEEYGFTHVIISFMISNADNLAKKEFGCLNDDFKREVIKSDLEAIVFSKLLPCIQMDDFDVPLKEIDNKKLELMIQNHYFDFSESAYNELNECAPELCTELILQNQEAYQDSIEDITLTKTVFEELILSDRTDAAIKKHIINRDGAELMTATTAQKVQEMDIVISKEVFSAVWEQLNSFADQKEFLFKHLRVLSSEDFEVYFEVLGEPYNRLKRDISRRDELIPDTFENRVLAARLRDIQFITSYDLEERSHFDKQHGIIKEPMIRCRLKAKQ